MSSINTTGVLENFVAASLAKATSAGHVALVQELANKFPDLVDVKSNGNTCLHIAICKGHTELVSFLLCRGASVSVPSNDGSTALHHAAFEGHYEILKLLVDHIKNNHTDLEREALVNSINVSGCTPLHLAVRVKSTDCVNLLVESGSRPDIQDSFGESALDIARRQKSNESRGMISVLTAALQDHQSSPGSTITNTSDHSRSEEQVTLGNISDFQHTGYVIVEVQANGLEPVEMSNRDGEVDSTVSHEEGCSSLQIAAMEGNSMSNSGSVAREGVRLTCEICGKCVLKRNLRAHQRTHSNTFKQKCDLCPRSYPRLKDLLDHYVVSHGRRLAEELVCEVCGKSSGTYRVFRKHQATHKLKNSSVVPKKKTFACELCSRHFTTKRSLKRHTTHKHNERSVSSPCPICGKVFRRNDGLARHVKTHNDSEHQLRETVASLLCIEEHDEKPRINWINCN